MPADARNNDQKITGSVTLDAGLNEPVRSLAHDLGSPLTSMKSCLDLVLSGETGDLTADQRRFLGMAQRNIDRMDRMVQDMLTVSRMSKGPTPARRREVDLGPILRETVRLHKVTATSRDLDVDYTGLPESFPARVDPDLVVRMLDNVLGNALKYTGSGGMVRVWLESGPSYPPCLAGRLARHCSLPLANFNLIVEDNGPGLSPAVQSRIFEPFNRGSDLNITGTGLGLSITRGLAQSHGGQVRLISLPGRGTTVWLKLPRDPATEHLQLRIDLLAEGLARGSEHGVKPLIGILDLRQGPGGEPLMNMEDVEGFFGREPSGFATAWEIAPGLWTTAVLDPVNWSRRWTLYAARVGGGLEVTRWEYLAGEPGEDPTVAGKFGKQQETMVNPAPDGPNKG
ncbi:MAG: HAMP domain-containing histidine kinase [Candidatus Krumholzibacteria bacterium]|nr:HAMP domain-containing histidine kinase [Candidatus Krumholzibacteria bacterium]